MRFKAKIKNLMGNPSPDVTGKKSFGIFQFSKKRIWFTKHHKSEIYSASLYFGVNDFSNGAEYTFDKGLTKEEKKDWLITSLNGKECKASLQLNLWNKIKCNIIHGRYFIYREREWFLKTLIAATVGFFFSLIGLWIGYRQGYAKGKAESQVSRQDTTQRR